MCGRFALSVYQTDLAEELGLNELPPDYRPRYNIAPTQPVLAVRAAKDGAAQAVWLRWGLIPFWAKDPAIGNRMINARAETLGEKPAYRRAFERNRCLVVADAFYEWRKTPAGKVPTLIRLASARPFTFAGVAERWRSPEDEEIESCAIVTTSANDFVRPIHDRMPVIVPREDRERWLDPRTGRAELDTILRPYDGALEAFAISTLVNSPGNDRPEVMEPDERDDEADESSDDLFAMR